MSSNNLRKLAFINNTDKGSHGYVEFYDKYFRSLRKKKLSILEIGVAGGGSLRMWKYFFPKSMIYGIDICDKSALQEKRITIFKGDQSDEVFLRDVFSKIGSLDIIIDDGSHMNAHVISSFRTLFPLLNEGGVYVVEDLQTSYWPKYGGDNENLQNPKTTMNYFKSLTDGLNYQEFRRKDYEPSYFETHIASIHFYHNMIVIYKKKEKVYK
jgi:demethylmacrocin O-methyltransferase